MLDLSSLLHLYTLRRIGSSKSLHQRRTMVYIIRTAFLVWHDVFFLTDTLRPKRYLFIFYSLYHSIYADNVLVRD
jgi:hypothetical protein